MVIQLAALGPGEDGGLLSISKMQRELFNKSLDTHDLSRTWSVLMGL